VLLLPHNEFLTSLVETLLLWNIERGVSTNAGDFPMYPAMSKQEVEEWLDHVPVFAVTDEKGQGVVLRPDENTSVFYFFMSPLMANATLTQLKETSNAEGMELRVSAFSLGRIWFNVLNSDENREVMVSLQI
jgi:hypothetical protein